MSIKKLNLTEIDKLTGPSKLQYALGMFRRTFRGTSTGITVGGIIFTLLALAGISAASLVEIIGGLAGATVFGTIAIVVTFLDIRRGRKQIEQQKKDYVEALKACKKSLIELMNDYELINEHLLASEGKSQFIKDKAAKEIADLELEKEEIIKRIQVILSLMEGDSNEDRLSNLFSSDKNRHSTKTAITQFAGDQGWDVAKLNSCFNGIWDSLSTKFILSPSLKPDELSTDVTTKAFQQTLYSNITKPTSVKSPGLKRIGTVLSFVGGVFSGAGTTLGIAALVLGGAATLLTGGLALPMLVAAIGVGIGFGLLSLYIYRKLKSKQQKTLSALSTAQTQLTSMKEQIEEGRSNVKDQIEKSTKRQNTIAEDQFNTYSPKLEENRSKLSSITVSFTKIKQRFNVDGVKTSDELTAFSKEFEKSKQQLIKLKGSVETIKTADLPEALKPTKQSLEESMNELKLQLNNEIMRVNEEIENLKNRSLEEAKGDIYKLMEENSKTLEYITISFAKNKQYFDSFLKREETHQVHTVKEFGEIAGFLKGLQDNQHDLVLLQGSIKAIESVVGIPEAVRKGLAPFKEEMNQLYASLENQIKHVKAAKNVISESIEASKVTREASKVTSEDVIDKSIVASTTAASLVLPKK